MHRRARKLRRDLMISILAYRLQFMNWPEEEWTRASYDFPGLNEVPA
jgi:hypothetical protein